MINRLVLGEGFREGPLSSERERLILDGDRITVADLGLGRRRELPGAAHYNCPLAVDSRLGRVYFSDGDLFSLDLTTGECVKVAGPLPLELDPERVAEVQRRYVGPEEFRYQDRSAYVWLLSLSPDGQELVSSFHPADGTTWVARVRPGTGEVGYWKLDWGARLSADLASGRLCHSDHRDGPRILDLDGRCLATLSPDTLRATLPEWSDTDCFGESAFRPGTPEVALQQGWMGIVLWDTRSGKVRLVDPEGLSPAWSPDGRTLWYMRQDGEELWCWQPDGRMERIAALEGPSAPPRNGGACEPVPSPCGCYLYAQLYRGTGGEPQRTIWYGQECLHHPADICACVIDLEDRVVHLVPGEHHHNVAWLP